MDGQNLPGLPATPFSEWLKSAVPGLFRSGGWSGEVISGGLSNITYRLRFADRTIILRRPPLGRLLPSAHDMQREYRVLTALRPTDAPVPETFALCSDPNVLGAPFYLMADVPGNVIRSEQDAAKLTVAERAALADDLIRRLADLHAIDPQSVGLGDYGRPDGYCARQIRRWGEQWLRSRTRDLPDMDILLKKAGRKCSC